MYDFNQLIGSIKLSRGRHDNPENGMCAMEFVSWLEGEKFTDHPKCTCPVIAEFVRSANDKMDQAGRDRLLPYLPRIVGTVAPEFEQQRAEFLAWQVIRVFAPDALTAIGLHEHAKKLMEAETLSAAAYTAAYAADAAADAADAAADAAAYAAAYTAAYTADAADAAADAAAYTAAYAAYAAADAAYAAADAAYAAAADWDKLFECLDGLLEIGPKGQGFTSPVEPVIAKAKIVAGA